MLRRIWYRTKVLSVLQKEFSYNPAVPGLQSPVFNEVTKMFLKNKWSEYDAAAYFIIIQCRELSFGAETKIFIDEKLRIIKEMRHKFVAPPELYNEAVMELVRTHNLGSH